MSQLNKAQQIAVYDTVDRSALVLAGAGSGKTQVLISRIGHLIQDKGIKPYNILAVTFTNKAADEMRSRIADLIGRQNSEQIWMGTFHGICVRMLKVHGESIGLPKSFTIYDTADSRSVIKDVLQKEVLQQNSNAVRILSSRISELKNKMITPHMFSQMVEDDEDRLCLKVYEDYTAEMRRLKALDFDDLILFTVLMLTHDEEVRKHYQDRFKYITVDEHQDSNKSQYELIRLLVGEHNNLFLVGDDAQCLAADSVLQTRRGPVKVQDLKTGDMVQTIMHSCVSWQPVTNISQSAFQPVLEIKTDSGHVATLSRQHKMFATLPLFDGKYYVYLMWRPDKGFRLGITKGGLKGVIGARAHSESPRRLWVLRQFQTLAEATYNEELWSLKWRIPTLPYFRNGRGIALKQEHIDRIFDTFGNNGNELLKDFGYSFEHPNYIPQNTTKKNSSIRNVVLYMGNQRGSCSVAFESKRQRVRKQFGGLDAYKKALVFAEKLNIDRKGDGVIEKLYTRYGYLNVIPADGIMPSMQIPVIVDNEVKLSEVISVTPKLPVNTFDVEIASTGIIIADGVLSHNSIYAFRGANIQNILNFEHDFPNAMVVKLEQNYRSTRKIVAAGNAIIAHNENQKPKQLYTENNEGHPVFVHTAESDRDEAYFVARRIAKYHRNYKDVAILYRANYQSRAFEDALIKFNIPYRLIGGLSFYERKEVRDSLAYLRIIHNQGDDVAFKRIFLMQPGLGMSTAKVLQRTAIDMNISMFEAAERYIGKNAKIQNSVDRLVDIVRTLRTTRYLTLGDLLQRIWDATGYIRALEQEDTHESRNRIENLQELIKVTEDYRMLDHFLERISLISDVDEMTDGNYVRMMTVHASKGLEFPVVFLTGLEEGTFPHANSMSTDEGREEERRLAYVAVTRAEEYLYLSHCSVRTSYNSSQVVSPSRFLSEIPNSLKMKI